MIKFPTDYGVRELCGNQVATRECYIAMMEMDNHLRAMNIKERQIVIEPVERLKELLINNCRND